MNKNKKPLVIVILGTTASGKTSLGVKLAKKFKGEIISADSRQVYKGMDIGSGKDLKEYGKIPYHLIDVVKPKTKFSLAKYQKLAFSALDDVIKRGKLPIIVGGTGLYLQALVDNYKLSSNKPDHKLRDELEKLGPAVLFKRLEKINPVFAVKLNNSDKNNARRLARYIEVLSSEVNFKMTTDKKNSKYEFLILGLDWPKEVLSQRIKKRIMDRLEQEDMIGEIKRLHEEGVSWKRLEGFGLEYKFIALFLQKKLSLAEMIEKLHIAVCQFSKKQKSWWKRWEKQGQKIYWVKDLAEAEKVLMKFGKIIKSQ